MKTSIRWSRFRNVGRSVLVFLTSQAITQFLALIAGFLVIRLLSVENYATYAIIGASIGAANVLSDLGISSATTTLLSRASNPRDFSKIHAGATSLRILLGASSTLVILMVFMSTDVFNQRLGVGATWLLLIAMAAIIILQASANLARAVLASQKKLSIINRADPLAALIRVVLVGGVFLFAGTSSLAVPVLAWFLSALLVAYWLNRNLPRVRLWPFSLPPKGLLAMIWPLLPGHIYYLVSSLLPVMTLGERADPEALAAFWALGRLGLIISSLNPFLVYIAHPYVARGHSAGFLRRSLLVIVATTVLVLSLVTSGYLFSDIWLLLIGPKYADFGSFVWVAMGVAGSQYLVSTFNRMCIASGVPGHQYLAVAAGIITQFFVYTLTPMNDLADIYFFVAAPTVAQFIVYFLIYLRSVRLMKEKADGNA